MRIFEHARRSRFIRHNVVFFFGAAAVGALNYLYYPVMGRLLDTASFGEVQTLISLFLQITIFLSVLGLVTITVVTNSQPERRDAVILEIEKVGLGIGLLLLVLTVLFGGALERFFRFDSMWPFVLLALALVVSVPFTSRGAFLRGRQRFGRASLINLVSAAGKLVFAVLLVGLGLKTAGAIGGLIAAQVAACGLAVAWAAKAGLARPAGYTWRKLPDFRLLTPELRYGLLVLIVSLLITLQYSLDVVVVKHFFDPHTAGLYAGIATIARIIFFLTASIALVLMSLVRPLAPVPENRKVLFGSLALTVLVGLPVVALAAFKPVWLTTTLMGSTYQQMAGLLPKLSLAVFIVSILNVIVSYYLALKRYALAPVLVCGGLITYWLMYAHHATLGAVVNSLLMGSCAMLAAVGVWLAGRHFKESLYDRQVTDSGGAGS